MIKGQKMRRVNMYRLTVGYASIECDEDELAQTLSALDLAKTHPVQIEPISDHVWKTDEPRPLNPTAPPDRLE